MEIALPIIAVCGFFTGGLLVQQVLRWIALLSVVIANQQGEFLGPPRRRLLWVVPFAFFLHPGLYSVGALMIITVLCLLNRLSGAWGWFLAGLYTYVAVTGLSIASR